MLGATGVSPWRNPMPAHAASEIVSKTAMVIAALAFANCTPTAAVPEPAGAPSEPLRLASLATPERIAGAATAAPDRPRTEWRFDAPSGTDALSGFRAHAGVESLRVEAGQLRGRTAPPVALLRVDVPASADADERLHAVEVRMRASAGKELRYRFVDAPATLAAPPPALLADLEALGKTALQPGDELRSYTIPAPLGVPRAAAMKTLLLSPSDAPGAEFAIESVRVVLNAEHLASIASGPGWHGLDEIYHQSLVLRPGERLALPVVVPSDALLISELGTPSTGAVRFRVDAVDPTGARTPLLRHTTTTQDRWERVVADARALAGRDFVLELTVEADAPGAVGIFGAPTLHARLAAADAKPRVVLLLLGDTLRRDHLGVYGYARETAPTLRRLAEQGALFRDAVAQGSWTKVSTTSIFTGLYQSSHGVQQFYDRLPDAAVTMAEIFHDAGYATVGYSSVMFTGRFTNLHQGYDSLHEMSSVLDGSMDTEIKTGRAYTDRFLDWLDDHRDVRSFAFIQMMDPHDPFEPRDPYATLWADPGLRARHLAEVEKARPFIEWPFMRQRGLADRKALEKAGIDPAAHVAQHRDWYDGSIRGMDAEIARIVERLEALGLADDTLLVFAADHGEEFHDHGGVFHGQTLYGEMLDVPLIVWAPGRVPAGVTIDSTVELIDVLPTLVELAGIETSHAISGASLVPRLRGAADPSGPTFAEKAPDDDPSPGTRDAIGSTAAISADGKWKLIQNDVRPEGVPEVELYDRRGDPLDQHDVAAAHPDLVASLRGEIERWRADAARLALPKADAADALAPEEAERLRALGYGD
jgi:arylsulfatase A-like enzyme